MGLYSIIPGWWGPLELSPAFTPLATALVIEPFLIRSVRCLQTRAFLMIVSVQSARFITFNHSCFFFFCLAVAAALKFQFRYFKILTLFSQFRDYISILIRKINWSFSLLSYIPHIWPFFPSEWTNSLLLS